MHKPRVEHHISMKVICNALPRRSPLLGFIQASSVSGRSVPRWPHGPYPWLWVFNLPISLNDGIRSPTFRSLSLRVLGLHYVQFISMKVFRVLSGILSSSHLPVSFPGTQWFSPSHPCEMSTYNIISTYLLSGRRTSSAFDRLCVLKSSTWLRDYSFRYAIATYSVFSPLPFGRCPMDLLIV